MKINFTERKEKSPIIEGSSHTWLYCEMCGWAVRCGNNCCNGGAGDNCPDKCNEAYELQDNFFNNVNYEGK